MATWVETVRAMGKWYEKNIHSYQSRGDISGSTGSGASGSSGATRFFPCPLIGGKEVINDCCGFVGSCLTAFGVPGIGHGKRAAGVYGAGSYVTNTKLASILSAAGFQRMPFDSNHLIEGDIYASSGHVEIFACYNGTSSWKSWGWGNIHDGINGHAGQPNSTGFRPGQTGSYKVLWRYTGNANVTLGPDGNLMNGFDGYGEFPEGTTFKVNTPRSNQQDHLLMEELASVKLHLLKEALEFEGILFDYKRNLVEDIFVYDKYRQPILNTDFNTWEIKTKYLKLVNQNKTDIVLRNIDLAHHISNKLINNYTYLIKYNNEMAPPEKNGDATIGEGIANKAVEMGLLQLGMTSYCGMLGNFDISMDQDLTNEMEQITIDISKYPGVAEIIGSLQKAGIPGIVIAGLIGCIIPESGTNHRILNAKEYRGGGVSGTSGWNCGEGLVQWTFWKYKLPLIQKYNSDSRVTQKLPTDWATYSKGTPKDEGGKLIADEDGQHIAGLTLDNQMIFLAIYYDDLIKELSSETNLAVVCAKIYQKKAGNGFCQNISDPIKRAYETAKQYYPSSAGNHFLKSLKFAQQACNIGGVTSSTSGIAGGIMVNGGGGGSAFLNKLFGQSVPTNTGTAGVQKGQHCVMPSWMEQQMVPINIFGKTHKVHKSAVANFTGVWNDIQRLNLPYAVNSAGTLSFRVVNNGKFSNNMKLSNHSYGLAIDINVGANPFKHGEKAPASGKPTNTAAMRSFDHPVVQAFLRNGFGWGGAYGDYMHFSIPNGG